MELDTSRPVEAVPGNLPSCGLKKRSLAEIKGQVHFVGVGGIGMSALARLLLAQGRKVSGSDKAAGPITDELKEMGARIYIGHNAENVDDAEAIVVSTAINKENPELAKALDLDLPVFHRSEMLSYLTEGKKLIAVSGTHGKTTCTGMISQIMIECGKDPSVVVGGVFAYLKSNSRTGKSEYFVAEADESDRTHAGLSSEIAVVTNIEADHLENYPGGFEQILSTMAGFANKASGFVVICGDDEGCRKLATRLSKKVVSYGKSSDSDYWFKAGNQINNEFQVFKKDGTLLGSCSLSVPGIHNIYNALASITACLELGLDFEEISRAVSSFSGVARRFDKIGESRGVLVVDDYGHHPSELKATLKAARQFQEARNGGKGRIVAVFQPHQPGRLRDLWQEFCDSFIDADLVLLADVYVARGGQIEGINSETFSKQVKHSNAHYIGGSIDSLPEKILPYLQSGDLLLTIGAGDITNLGKPLLALLDEKGLDGKQR